MLQATWGATTAAARAARDEVFGVEVQEKKKQTAKQRHKAKRDAVILLCDSVGLSHRYIAEVFDLARSQIANIVSDEKKARGLD